MKKFNEIKNEFVNRVAQAKVNVDMQREIFQKANKYYKVVDKVLNSYVSNYVKICKYLYFDFKVKKATLGESTVIMKEEFDFKNDVKKFLKENKRLKVIDKLNVNLKIRKWYVLSVILKEYKDLLNLLVEQSGKTLYKDIDINYEIAMYEERKYLIDNTLHYAVDLSNEN